MKRPLTLLCVTSFLCACGERDAAWDSQPTLPVTSLGLESSVAVLDPPLDRVLMLTPDSEDGLHVTSLRLGKAPSVMQRSADGKTLYVLSDGVQPRRSPDDELPGLTVIDGGIPPRVKARFTLSDPVREMAIDPLGEWVVLHGAQGVVANPNELILVRADDASSTPIPKTLRSFGGRPRRLSFTPVLDVPNGPPRRLLVVQTDYDVSLIDLLEPERDEVTIVLPKRKDGTSATPAQVVAHDGDPEDSTDARLAIRLAGDSDVVIVQLSPPLDGENKPFRATINIADVGGTPSSIDFVRTDGGLRLAALVPSKRMAALVDPATTVVDEVNVEAAYTDISLVTDDVKDKPDVSDVALLWSRDGTRIAFWSLGKATGTPYRSLDAYDIGAAVTSVHDVPGEANAHLKLLETKPTSTFYVLDLNTRENFPLLGNTSGFTLTVAPDGARAWAYRAGTPELARINLTDFHPVSLVLERPISSAWDVTHPNGGRALVALHASASDGHASLGATLLDALSPDTASSRYVPGLLLGGIQ